MSCIDRQPQSHHQLDLRQRRPGNQSGMFGPTPINAHSTEGRTLSGVSRSLSLAQGDGGRETVIQGILYESPKYGSLYASNSYPSPNIGFLPATVREKC